MTLPAEIVKEFKLKKGMSVDVTIHPQTRAVTIRPGVKLFEEGKVTKRFETLSGAIMSKYEDAFAELAK